MKKTLVFVFISSLLLSGCDWWSKTESRPHPDVSKIDLALKSHRFDQDVFALSNSDFAPWKQKMVEQYGEFYYFYIDNFVIGPRPMGDTSDIEEKALRQFVSDKYMRAIQDSINHIFPNTKNTDEQLAAAFKYCKYYLPEFEAPEVIYFNSGYSAGASPFGKKQLVIGLDMFLGDGNTDYDSVGVYQYLRHKMKPAYIPRYAMESLLDAYFDNGMNPEENLLDAIVERGKKMYFLSLLFPDAPDSLLLGYTAKQTEFCVKSQKEIWKFLNDKDVLLKNNSMDKSRYLGEGPTTSGMPLDAPGNIGSFVGLSIVRKFMNESGKSVTPRDLMIKYQAKVIFEKAKYRP